MAKATYKRAARVADQIRMEVADILMRKAKDPRIGSVTVTDVELTNDLRLARVYVTTLQEDDGESDVLAGLAKASGFIRAELGRRLSLRYTPDLMFKKDVSGPRGDRILSLLEGLGAKRPNAQPRGNESSVAGGRHADD
ncbi:MAG TPA: 30S ribosome-binding factor RbfA [Nitrospiraceae bacterium]|nr:30S ribosome-binding factor RbfA [Nitrospiraceae bacterium]